LLTGTGVGDRIDEEQGFNKKMGRDQILGNLKTVK
jgi:hypothetical protein